MSQLTKVNCLWLAGSAVGLVSLAGIMRLKRCVYMCVGVFVGLNSFPVETIVLRSRAGQRRFRFHTSDLTETLI